MKYQYEKREIPYDQDPLIYFNQWGQEGWRLLWFNEKPVRKPVTVEVVIECIVEKCLPDEEDNSMGVIDSYGNHNAGIIPDIQANETPGIIKISEQNLPENQPVQEDLDMPRATIVMPCYGRPARTERAINSVIAQNITNFEAIFIGDNCPDFKRRYEQGEYQRIKEQQAEKGNRFEFIMFDKNAGGYGHAARNFAKRVISGRYICFIDNDDTIKPNHLQHYLSEIENTNFDFVFYNSFIQINNVLRESRLEQGHIGHSELIIKTDFYKTLPEQKGDYGHDWVLINEMINKGALYKKADSKETTYEIRSLADNREAGID